MTLKQIIDTVYPITPEHRRCSLKMQKLQYQRQKLSAMIEAYRRGDIVHWEGLKLSVDLSPLLERLNN